MKVRIYFEPLTLEIPDDDPIFAKEELPSGEADDSEPSDIDIADLTLHIEENWSELVDPTEPVIGAIVILPSAVPSRGGS
jgi:hypothetical protein